jgi:hypothetical protein
MECCNRNSPRIHYYLVRINEMDKSQNPFYQYIINFFNHTVLDGGPIIDTYYDINFSSSAMFLYIICFSVGAVALDAH